MTKVVWLVSWWPNPADPTHGIFNKRWAECVKNLVDLKVVVADPSQPSGLRRDKQPSGYVLYRMGFTDTLFGKLQTAISSVQLLQKLRSWAPDYLHIFSPAPFGRIKPWVALKRGAKLIVVDQTVSTKAELERLGPRVTKVYARTFSAADIIHLTNEEQADRLREIGLLTNKHQLNVISNIVPEADEMIIPKPVLKNSGASFRFHHISGLRDYQKNVSGIIRAFAKIIDIHPQATLLIGGDGPDKQKLEGLVQSLGLSEDIVFLGALNRMQVRNALNNADTLVMFSRREIDSVISLEAMSMDVPLILSAFCSAAHKLQGGKFGTLVPIEDEKTLAEAMRIHINNDWRKAVGAQEFLKSFAGPKAILSGFANLYGLTS